MAPPLPLLPILLLSLLLLPLKTTSYTPLTPPSLHALPRPASAFEPDTGPLLSPLLQPRVPGTPGQASVQHFLSSYFSTHLPTWTTTFQNSTAAIPALDGATVPFANFIATRAPPDAAEGEISYLTLVAHYDSLRLPEGFIGATDSAVPCAVLLHAATVLDEILTAKWSSSSSSSSSDSLEPTKGIQLLFLDGEEAFGTWSHTDSIYGARSLAAAMAATPHPALSTFPTALSAISLFVLLDLLGAAAPRIPSFSKTTHWAYARLAGLHARLGEEKLLRGKEKEKERTARGEGWFPDAGKDEHVQWFPPRIEDDHLPFLARGVEVLHLIPSPFPGQWHKSWDDGEHLDLEVCGDWAVLMAGFVAEWMDLEGFVVGEGGGGGKEDEKGKRKVGKRDDIGEDGGRRVTSKTEL